MAPTQMSGPLVLWREGEARPKRNSPPWADVKLPIGCPPPAHATESTSEFPGSMNIERTVANGV